MLKKSINIVFISVLFFVFILVRIINLDADLQPFSLMNYSGIDEFYYSMVPFNLVNYGKMVNPVIPNAELDSTPLVLTLNFFTTITLKIFGNNYFGLRLGSVFCSLTLFIFFVSCLKKTSLLWMSYADNRKSISNYVILIILLYFSIDYSYVTASRVSEPGISRSLLLVFLIWYIAHRDTWLNKKPLLFSFLLGFFALFSVCFVYLYNVFFVGAAGLTLLLILVKEHQSFYKIIKNILFFILGALVCCILYECFIRLFLGRSFLDFLETLTHYSNERVNAKQGLSVILKLKKIFLIDFGTNVFRLNLPFLMIFLLSIPVYFYRVFKTKSNVDIFVASLLVFWFAQSFFENTYPLRRHTIMLPVFVLIVIYSFEEITLFIAYLNNLRINRILYVLYFVVTLVLIYSVINEFFVSFSANSFGLDRFMCVNIMCVITSLLLMLAALYLNKLNLVVFGYISLFFLIPNLYLLVSRIGLNSTYKYKKTMIDMNKYIDNEITIGGVSYGFRLYNGSKPALNTYAYMYTAKPEFKKRFIELLKISNYCIMIPDKNNADITHGYSPMEVGYLQEVAKETDYAFRQVKRYDIGDRDVLLMEKIKKPNVIPY